MPTWMRWVYSNVLKRGTQIKYLKFVFVGDSKSPILCFDDSLYSNFSDINPIGLQEYIDKLQNE